jgi:hypothetical protein
MHFKDKIAELPNPVGYTGAAGDVYIVGTKEYVYVAGETPAWIELGDEGSHVVKGTYTVTLTPSKSSVTSSGSYQPAGSVSKPTFTGDGTSITVETEKDVVTGVSGGQVTMPNGTVSKPTFTGTTATITSTSSYRPAGSISLTGKTDDYAIKTLTTAQAVASASVDGELLTLTTGTYATGVGSTVSVVSALTGATFSGTTATITSTGSYQPAGEVSQPTFSWATTNSTKTVGVASLTVSKEKVTSSGAYTPTGSVSQPTFTGTTATITVTSAKEYMESATGSVALS